MGAASGPANRAYPHIRQWHGAAHDGILRVARITVRDITEARAVDASVRATLTQDHYTAAQTDSAVAASKTELRAEAARSNRAATLGNLIFDPQFGYQDKWTGVSGGIVSYGSDTANSDMPHPEFLQIDGPAGDTTVRAYQDQAYPEFNDEHPWPEYKEGSYRFRVTGWVRGSTAGLSALIGVRKARLSDGAFLAMPGVSLSIAADDTWQRFDETFEVDVLADQNLTYVTLNAISVLGSAYWIRFASLVMTDVSDVRQLDEAVTANLSSNYLTSVETDAAIAASQSTLQTNIDSVDASLSGKIDEVKALDANALNGSVFGTFLTQMNVAADGTVAGIENFGSAMADVHGRASAAYVLRAKSGGSTADLELVAWSDATGGGSAIKLNADMIVASGTLSADALKANTALLGSITVDGRTLASISTNSDAYRYRSMRAMQPAVTFGTGDLYWVTHEPDTQIYVDGELLVDAPSKTSGNTTIAQGAVIEANKPIGLAHASSELVSFAQIGQAFFDNWSRNNNYKLYVYSPYADAEITVKISGFADVVFTVPAGTFVSHADAVWATFGGSTTVEITSNSPILLARNANSSDIYSLWPADRREWVTRQPRIVANNVDIETEEGGGFFTYVKFVEGHAAALSEVGDGAGGDASFSVPVDALANRYILPHETNDWMIGAVEPCIIKAWQADGTLYGTYDFSAASKEAPMSHSEGSIAGTATTPAAFPAGMFFEGTAPFFIRSNARHNQDEYVPMGWREELRAEFNQSTFGSLSGNVARWANDPAARVNSGLTLIEPGKIVTEDLASLSAKLGNVVVNENLRIEDEAGLIYGRESRSDYEVPGFFLGSTKKADGSRDFEVAHTHMDENGRLSGVVHSEDAGFRVYNPKFLVQPPTSNPATNSVKYTTSNTFSLGTGMTEVTVVAVGAGGAGGYGLEDGYHNTPAASGSNTAFWLYAGDPNAGGVLIEGPITALGGAGGENASSSASGYTGTAGGSTTFGAGGGAGSPQQAGTSAETTSYGAGGGGAGGDSPSTFDSSGGAGLGGQAGEEITTTVDLTAHLGTEIFITTAIGSRGVASGGNYAGGNGAHGVVAVANPLAGHEELDGHFLVDQTLEGLANSGRERTHVVMDTAELGPYSENRLFIIETVTSSNTSNDYRVRTVDATPRRIIVNMPGEIAYDSLLGNTVNQTLDGSFRNPTGTCWVFLEAGAIQSFDGGGRYMTWTGYREIIGVSEDMARRIIERIT